MEQLRIPLNVAQTDFLQLLGHIKTVAELEELSQVVSDFYVRKAEEGMNRLWEQASGSASFALAGRGLRLQCTGGAMPWADSSLPLRGVIG